MERYSYEYIYELSIQKFMLIVFMILHIVWLAGSWRNFNNDTLYTPGCAIPDYNLEFSEYQDTQPACRRLIEVEKVDPNRIRFLMRKPMESCCFSFVHSHIGAEDQDMRFVIKRMTASKFHPLRYLEDLQSWSAFTPCVPFKDQTETKLVSDVVNVECDSDYETIYEDTYFLVKEVEVDRDNVTAENVWNVLILSVDGMSRRRAYSILPRAIQFLHRNDWFDFRGYNAIDNAVVAILTGATMLNNTTPLWLTYQQSGYVTASNQEALLYTNISEKPTHYISPYSLADEINCTKQTADRTLEYILDFTTTYRNKFFGFFSFKSIKDDVLTNFFNKLTLTGKLYNTFVVLTSNGNDPLSSFETFYDARLPLSFMWIPTTFRRNYKTQFSFVRRNQFRLVSPLDFHLTLLNILRKQEHIPSCRKCSSLFQKISEYRYCSDAGIDKYWCACHNMIVANHLEHTSKISLVKAVDLVESEVYGQSTTMCMFCRNTTYKNLLRMHYAENDTGVNYVMAFVMTPDVAVEVSVYRYLDDEDYMYNVHDVEVLTKIGNRGSCVLDRDSIYRGLCLCDKDSECFLTFFLTAEMLRRKANLSRFDFRRKDLVTTDNIRRIDVDTEGI